MTTSTPRPWHCEEAVLVRFVDGTVDPVSGASVETHLMTCATCRGTVGRLSDQDLLAGVWADVREALEAPARGRFERLMCRCGFSEETACLLAAVPAMRGAWLLAVLGATLFAVVAAAFSGQLGTATFLVLAPLAPLAGVAVSFGGDGDPAHELVVVSPYSALRLLLLRTAAVVVTAVPVTVAVGLTLPGPHWLSVAWLTPAAAGVSLTLALGPRLGHMTSATVIAALWAAAVGSALRLDVLLALVRPAAQAAFLLLALAGAARVIVDYRSLGQSWRYS
ncbi:MAG: hypothetical protein ABIQ59_15395 [Nocardioidaceae bacterium]